LRKKLSVAVAALALLGVSATVSAQQSDFVPVTDEMLANPNDGDWLMWRNTLNGWGYSPLDMITRDNVDELRFAWARAMEPGFQEGTPLVYDGVMYLPHARGVIQALDATNGNLIWEYRRQLPADLAQVVALSDITRNLAITEDKVLYSTPDGFMVALDAVTGQVVWETQVFDYQDNTAMQTSGPITFGGKIFSGRSCLPSGGPEACFVTAHDVDSGEELWRFYTIPRPGEPGDETWGDVPYESRMHVGTWMVPSFDPELNLVYFGTSVSSPYAKFTLGDVEDDYLYQTSTLAIDGDTGELVWYYQHLRDHWDLDHPFERLLVDTVVAPDPDHVRWISPNVTPGEERKILTGIPGKTGIVYALDRATGEFLWATETVQQNVITDIDPATGDFTINDDVVFTEVGQEFLICPAAAGGKDWMAGAYSPDTNAMYYPLHNICMNTFAYLDDPAELDQGLDFDMVIAPGEEHVGTLRAVSAETGETLWLIEQDAAFMSVVATGGGLLFVGDVDQRFRAIDQLTGEIVWETILGSSITGYPITYAVDGEQYVAVAAGGALIDPNYIALAELSPARGSNMVYVFKLPAGN